MSAPPATAARGNTMLDAALDYVRTLNWSVFPCRARDKVPLTTHGVKDATKDPSIIHAWWTQWPDANVAVPAGEVNGFFVLDVDEHDGVSGNATLAHLEQEHGKLPLTVEQCTPSGGKHLLFRSNGTTIRNSAGKLGPGLDVRSDGGYIIVSPSIGQNGARYRWLRTPGPGQTSIADAPPWLLDLLAGPKPIASPAPPTLVATQSRLASPYAQAALEKERASVALAVKGS